MPYYGRAWSTSTDALNASNISGTKYGTSVTVLYETARDLAITNGRRYDPVEGVAWTAYRRETCTSTYGCVTSWRQVYYEDAVSLRAKYDVVNSYGLRGAGIWALGYDGTRTELYQVIEDKFITDTIPPKIAGSALSSTLISPNADGRLDTVTASLSVTGLDKWGYVVEPMSGTTAGPAIRSGTVANTKPTYAGTDCDVDGTRGPRRRLSHHAVGRRRLGQPGAASVHRDGGHGPHRDGLDREPHDDLAERRRTGRHCRAALECGAASHRDGPHHRCRRDEGHVLGPRAGNVGPDDLDRTQRRRGARPGREVHVPRHRSRSGRQRHGPRPAGQRRPDDRLGRMVRHVVRSARRPEEPAVVPADPSRDRDRRDLPRQRGGPPRSTPRRPWRRPRTAGPGTARTATASRSSPARTPSASTRPARSARPRSPGP